MTNERKKRRKIMEKVKHKFYLKITKSKLKKAIRANDLFYFLIRFCNIKCYTIILIIKK